MKKLFVLFVSGIVLLVALGGFIFLTGQQIPASASQPDEREDAVVLPTVIDPTIEPEKIPQIESLIQIIQIQVESMNEVLLQEGWLHTAALTQNTIPSQGNLPNGALIPQSYIMDSWYLLDQNRQVTSAVSFMRDEQGNIVQASVLYEGNWHNLTLNDVSPAMPFTPKLDYGFFERAALHPAGLSRSTVALDKGDAIVYILPIYLETPIVVAGRDTASTGTVEKIYFDPDTGALLKMELFAISESGEEVLDHVTTIIKREHLPVPSDEVARILEKIRK